jgi:hypothetical protein
LKVARHFHADPAKKRAAHGTSGLTDHFLETILACKSPMVSPIYALPQSARWAGKLFGRNSEV